MPPILPGYQLTERLWKGNRCETWRARCESDDSTCLLKIPNSPHPPDAVTEGLKKAYEMTLKGRLQGVVPALRLAPYHRSTALVLEDIGGMSLARYLLEFERPTLDLVLTFAIDVATTLMEIHRCGIIHGDLKPANIIVEPKSRKLYITDFDNAHWRAEDDTPYPAKLEGTLPYVSPEQTGRLDREVDMRSDLYSLGITIYELLSGHPPFRSSDPMELVSCHLTMQPPPPTHPQGVPPALANIVLKLLEKEPGQRYQSAKGLIHDLLRCQKNLKAGQPLATFRLGDQDREQRFRLARGLYGRDSERAEILDSLSRITNGALRSTFVSGYSGTGKSALVAELKRPVQKHGGHFCSGKFDQVERNIPYSGFVQAIEQLVGLLLAQSESDIEIRKARLNAVLYPRAGLLVELIPRLALLLGPQPPVEKLRGEEAERRFYQVFRQLLLNLASSQEPLVLFVDDLQWADLSSQKLFRALAEDSALEHILLIGAFRSNEVPPDHPLSLLWPEPHPANHRHISLESLSNDTVTSYVADSLHCSVEQARELSDLICSKTGGNAFFVQQFLQTLHSKGFLEQDTSSGAWRGNIGRIRQEDITENVADLMTERLKTMPEQTQRVLRYGACIGSQFHLSVLRMLASSDADPQAALQPSIDQGLILRSSEGRLSFLHDRVQQSAYNSIASDELEAVHLEVGRTLREFHRDSDESIFEVVAHFNRALRLLTVTERLEVIRLNLRAARRARGTTAYKSAKSFLETALAQMDPDAWTSEPELTFAIYFERCEVASLLQEHELMEELALLLGEHCEDDLQRVRVMEIRLYNYINRIQWEKVLELGFEALDILGETMITDPQPEQVGAGIQSLEAQLAGVSFEQLNELPVMSDESTLAAMRILKAITSAAYFSRPNAYPVVVFRLVELSLAHGNCAESAAGYVGYAVVQAAVVGNYPRAYQFGQLAMNLVEKFHAGNLAGHVTMIFNIFVRHWIDSLYDTQESLTKGARVALENGDSEYWSYSNFWLGCHALFTGSELGPLKDRLDSTLVEIERLQQAKGALLLHLRHLTNELIGDAAGERPSWDRDEETLLQGWTDASDWNSLCYCQGYQAIGDYLLGRHELCVRRLEVCDTFRPYLHGQSCLPVFLFYRALARFSMLTPGEDTSDDVQETLVLFEVWSQTCPQNYAHKRLLLLAETARITGQGDLWRLYSEAVDSARSSGFIQDEALAHERLGVFLLSRGDEVAGRAHLLEAHAIYRRWGAHAVAERLERQHSGLSLEQTSDGDYLRLTSDSVLQSLDLRAVLRGAQSLSRLSHLDTLLEQTMRILIQHSGADRGVLILSEGEQLFVEAEWSVGRAEPFSARRIPLSQAQLPESVVRYALRTGDHVVIEQADSDERFHREPYFEISLVKSVLCAPLVNAQRLSGVIYLENRSLRGAFTVNRVATVHILASQAAISIENSKQLQQLQRQHDEILQERERRHEEALKASALEAHNNALASFLAIASHDLKTPLAAIKFWAQLIDTSVDPVKSTRIRDTIMESSNKGMNLIQSYLDAVRVEMGHTLHLQCHYFDLAKLVEREYQTQAWEFCGDAPPPTNLAEIEVLADRDRLQQVIANLFANAFAHSPPGQPPTVSLRQEAELVRFEVTNQGAGIPAELQDKLFDRFETGRHNHGGTGLGLWICRVIIEAHGGRLGASSEAGRGSTFWFEIPSESGVRTDE